MGHHFLFRVRRPSNLRPGNRFLQLYLRGCLQPTSLLLYCSGVAFSPCCAIACSTASHHATSLSTSSSVKARSMIHFRSRPADVNSIHLRQTAPPRHCPPPPSGSCPWRAARRALAPTRRRGTRLFALAGWRGRRGSTTTAPAALQLGYLALQLLHSLLNFQQRHDEQLHRLRRLLPIGVGNRNALNGY